MAHHIKKYDKQQGIRMGWHKLTEVKELLTLENNYLREWEVVPVKLQKNGQDSKWTILECSDAPELEIGSPYNPESFKPVTNAQFLKLVEDSISGTQHKVASVGSVRNRGRVFISIELQGMSEFIAAGRKFSAYLNYGNGHDKSSVLWVNTSNTCIVCDNTFNINLFSVENKKDTMDGSDDISLRQRHTKNVVMQLPKMATLIDKAIGVQAEFQIQMEALSKVEIKLDDCVQLFAGFVNRKSTDLDKKLSTRARNTVDSMVSLFRNGNGNSGENLADAFSAVTDFYTHTSSVGRSGNMEKQYVSSEFGAGMIAKTEFWKSLRNDETINKFIHRGKVLLAAN